jgi:ribose 5-phosphate isomerase B
MTIVVGADHAGYAAKEVVREHLRALGYDLIDVGATSSAPVDFPDIAWAACQEVLSGRAERGVLVCGTGIGAAMAANKVNGIRAALAHDTYSAHQSVEHDDANVLCLGAQIVGPALMLELITTFLQARWQASEDFTRRLQKLRSLESASYLLAEDDGNGK